MALKDFLFLRFFPKWILILVEIFQMTICIKLYENIKLIEVTKIMQNKTTVTFLEHSM